MSRRSMQISLPNEILIPEVRHIIDNGSEVELMTKGFSMLPFIIGGVDSVRLKKVSFDDITVGNIVLAEIEKGRYVLHRVIAKDNDSLTLKGDGNLKGCEICRRGDLIGIVTGIISPSGKVKVPGNARVWRMLGTFPRRCILALYRRTILKVKQV